MTFFAAGGGACHHLGSPRQHASAPAGPIRRNPISEKRRLVRNTLAYSVVQVAQMISSFVFMPFLINRFGIANYGVFLLASSVTGYLGLLDLGVGATVIKFVAQYRATDDDEALGGLVSNVLVFYIGIGIVAAAFLALFAQFGVRIFSLDAEGVRLATNLFYAAGFVALFSWPATIGGQVLTGLQDYPSVAKVGVAVVAGNVLATAIVVFLHEGPITLLLANGLVGVLGGIGYAWRSKRHMRGTRVSLSRLSARMMKTIFSFSWVLFVTQLCSLLIYQQTDRIVLGIFVGPSAVALYEPSSKLHNLVSQLAGTSASAVMPAASQFDAQERPDALRALFLRGTKYVSALVLPVVVATIVLAPALILRWLGPTMASRALSAQVYVGHWLITSGLIVGAAMLPGMGRVKYLLGYAIGQAAGNLALSLVLVQRLGVLGVVLGTTITNIAVFPIIMRYMLRLLDLPASRWLRDIVLRVYPPLVVPLAISLILSWAGLTGSLVGVGATAAFACVAYWAVFYQFSLGPSEKSDVRELIRSALTSLGIVRGGDEAASA